MNSIIDDYGAVIVLTVVTGCGIGVVRYACEAAAMLIG